MVSRQSVLASRVHDIRLVQHFKLGDNAGGTVGLDVVIYSFDDGEQPFIEIFSIQVVKQQIT